MTRAFDIPTVSTDAVTRTLDATFLNTVANHPDVRPWLGGDGVLDLTPIVTDPRNVTLVTPHGGFVGVALGATRYEIHSLFEPEGRGAETIEAMRQALTYIFTATDAVDLVTKVPTTNPAAALLARRAGFEVAFTLPARWSATATVETDFLSLSIERWALRSALTPIVGEWFHTRIAAMLAAAHSTLPPHSDDDPVHDRMAGAAVLLVRAGNARKAERLYNRWAQFAGYPLIHVVQDHPVVMDLEGVIVEVRGQEMEMLSCL